MRCFLFALACGLVLLASPRQSGTTAQEKRQSADPPTPQYAKEIRPLLKTYCFECHSTKKKRGGLDLEKIGVSAAAENWPEVWDMVGDRLKSNEMPPAKSAQPKEAERQKLMAWVAHVAKL